MYTLVDVAIALKKFEGQKVDAFLAFALLLALLEMEDTC